MLSKAEKMVGTPEQPLSKLGALTYHSYWADTIMDYFADHKTGDNITLLGLIEGGGDGGGGGLKGRENCFVKRVETYQRLHRQTSPVVRP